MPAQHFSFLDVETTGTSSRFDRIIDIGIIRTDGEKIIDKFESLVNPGTRINPFITQLTGIADELLENAPSFYEIAPDIESILKDTILVAHNARFDYGFLKGEFKRLEKSFNSKHLCSVKLARRLFPGLGHYNLDSIMSNFNLTCARRHRAYDDAKVIYDFYKLALQKFSEEEMQAAINFVMKRPSIPIGISMDIVDSLPEKPGVYIFYGENNFPLYIGKSVNIRSRVLSHFAADLVSGTEREIAEQIRSIEYRETAGELGALLLESTLIKQQQPMYNRMLRYARKMTVLLKDTTPDGYTTAKVAEVDEIDVSQIENLLGTFRNKKQVKNLLYEIAKAYSLCPRILGLESGHGRCFYYSLGFCHGACASRELNLKYNLRFEEAFYKYKVKKWHFDGPVVIREIGDLEEGFVVDKWCLIGSLKNDYDLENLSREYRFDVDTYKILSKFLLKPTKSLSIRPLSTFARSV